MLKTVKTAFNSMFKIQYGWTGRKSIDATSKMMRTLMGTPKTESQSLLIASKQQVQARFRD